MWIRCLLAPVATLLLTAAPTRGAEPADLILRNGRIATVDDDHREVRALAVAGDRILAVGSEERIDALRGESTTVIDLDGRLAIPGFIESHGHFISIGDAMMGLDLMAVRSWDEVIELVAAAARRSEPGEWILGRGWHQEKWDRPPPDSVEGFPVHDALSAVSPDNPVLLTHASGHASFANRRAMELAGVSASTPDVPGGEILRDDGGRPVGIFRERAQFLIARAVTPGGGDWRVRAVELATAECIAKGVTSFQDAGSSFDDVDVLLGLAERGELGIRLWVMIREPADALRARLGAYAGRKRVGNGFLTVGGIKRSIDGALGPRGAWLLEPYADSPESTGLATVTVENVTEAARLALEHRLQMCVHAIGDRANREVLDVYERIFAAHPERRDLRWRIEHAQHLHPRDIPRFAELGVIAAMQGVHCTSDGPWVHARLGAERARDGAYVWRSLMESGALICNGTDAPVEDVDPIACFHATVSRRVADGSVFYGDQRMNRMEALRSYTINAAYAAFEEDVKGSLTPGKLADIVVLSKDILRVPESEIREAKVDLTILGGRVVHER
ncbi:MAG: amidohydrolase [Planctomycetota bacterium]|jgi:predicted amidohydrolase YtcJ